MKFLKFLLWLVLLLIVVFVVGGFLLPTKYEVERTKVIPATPEKIHSYLGDLKKWDEFMPWKEEDPSIEVKFGDKTEGVGASQTWTGKEGKGELNFTKSDPKTGIEYDMAFILSEDSRMESHASMTYSQESDGTKVAWKMNGDMKMPMPMGIASGWFALFADRSMGPMFQSGLDKLATRVAATK